MVAEGAVVPGALEHLDIQDRPRNHFPNPMVVASLKRLALEDKYLLPTGYTFVLPEVDATVNKPPPKCIAIYWEGFSYGVRFSLHPVIVDILNKYELAPAQIIPTSWHNICSFIATCELHGLTYRLCVYAGPYGQKGSQRDRGPSAVSYTHLTLPTKRIV